VDENGKLWDSLRGGDSIVGDLESYLNKVGGDLGIIEHWQQAQAGSSWSSPSQAFKWFVTEQTEHGRDKFFWKTGEAEAKKHYDAAIRKVGESRYRQSHAAYKAMMMEFLRKVEFKNNSIKKRLVSLIRTENLYVMQNSGLQKGKSGIIKRGAAESFSVFQKVKVYGSEVTTQDVPHTQIHGVYFFARRNGRIDGSFLSDRENEFVATAVDVIVNYLR
jgi:hypothetical protein